MRRTKRRVTVRNRVVVVVNRMRSSDPVVRAGAVVIEPAPRPVPRTRQPVGPNFEQPAAGERRLAPGRGVIVVEVLHHVPAHETEQHGRAKGKGSQRSQRQLHASPVRFSPRGVDGLVLRSAAANTDAEDLLHRGRERRRRGEGRPGPGLVGLRVGRLAGQTRHYSVDRPAGGRTRHYSVEPTPGWRRRPGHARLRLPPVNRRACPPSLGRPRRGRRRGVPGARGGSKP
mmetsp:Transcript_14772/g.60330  ORF Transcript_14772/g.60330 Transcript_14772/m.60330 type:complete len:229 (-) Transcript_14772:1276-1962(-)